jgi:tetratricopeptide (TPR) repeat protein
MRLTPVAIVRISIVVAVVASIAIVRTAWAGGAEWERLSTVAIEAYRQGRFSEAEAALKAALDEAEQGLEGRYVVVSFENLGEFYRQTDRFLEAESAYRRALDVSEAMGGTDGAALENPLKSLAWLYHRTGRYGEAYAYYERILTIARHHRGSDSPALAAYLVVMAELLRLREMGEPAARDARRALDIAERALGPNDSNIPTVLTELVWDLQILGRYEEAGKYSRRLQAMLTAGGSRSLALFRNVLAFRQDVLGSRHPSVAKALADVALALEATGGLAEADALYKKAIGILEDAGLGGSVGLLPLLTQYAGLLRAANHMGAARLIEARIEALQAVKR